MGVVEAKIQTVEEIYRLGWAAVASRRPCTASYHGLSRLFCPHRLGRNKEGELRVLCYQYGGESESGLQPAGFACKLALRRTGQAQRRKTAGRGLAHCPEPFASFLLYCRSRHRCGGSSRTGSAEGTLRECTEQQPCKHDSQCGDGIRIMPLGASRAAGSTGSAFGRGIRVFRRGLRGKKGS